MRHSGAFILELNDSVLIKIQQLQDRASRFLIQFYFKVVSIRVMNKNVKKSASVTSFPNYCQQSLLKHRSFCFRSKCKGFLSTILFSRQLLQALQEIKKIWINILASDLRENIPVQLLFSICELFGSQCLVKEKVTSWIQLRKKDDRELLDNFCSSISGVKPQLSSQAQYVLAAHQYDAQQRLLIFLYVEVQPDNGQTSVIS